MNFVLADYPYSVQPVCDHESFSHVVYSTQMTRKIRHRFHEQMLKSEVHDNLFGSPV